MNECCDPLELFQNILKIPAGLSTLPRELGTFVEFRAALLKSLTLHPELGKWRADHPDDFGLMLLEMFAYVADVLSLYDKVIADETYLRTSVRKESLQKLVALLGYLPR